MNQPSLTFALELKDYYALCRHVTRSVSAQSKRNARLFAVSGVVVGYVLVRLLAGSYESFLLGCAAVLVPTLIAMKVAAVRTRARLQPLPDGPTLSERWLTLTPEGLDVRSRYAESVTRWPAVTALEETPDYFFFRVDNVSTFGVPKRAFPSESAQRDFWASANEFRRLARTS